MLDLKQVEAVFTIIWPQQDWNGGDEGFCRAVAEKVVRTLQAVGPEPAVAVKPLEWKKPPHNESLSRAETDFGVYRAWTHFEAGGRWFWSLDGYQKASGEVSNEDEAKATCQADHDARISGRIRSALVATPPAERSAEPEFETAPDNGTPHEVLSYLLDCAKRWVPEARIVGNARAGDIERALELTLTPPAERAVEALPNWNGWRSIDTAPEDWRVILATAGGWVGEAIMLRDEDTGEQVWTWVDTGKPSLHSCYGWMPLPAPLVAPVLSDLRPDGFDGPTGAE